MNYSKKRNRNECQSNGFEPDQEDERAQFNPQGKNRRGNPRPQQQMEMKKKIDPNQKLLSDTKALIFGSKAKKQTDGKRDYNANQEEPKQMPQCQLASIYRKQNQQFKEQKDYEIEMYQKAGQPRGEREDPTTRTKQQHREQESNWYIQSSDKEDKNTYETNEKQDPICLKAEEFPSIQETVQEKPEIGRQRGNRQGRMRNQGQRERTQNRNSGKKVEEKILDWSSSSEEPQQGHLSSLNNGRLAFDSHDISVTALSNLLDQEEPAPEDSSPAISPKTPPIQEIEQSLTVLTSLKKATVCLVFEVEDNILQFRVKEIELVPLAVTATISSVGQIKLKKYPGISGELLQKYITVIDASHYFPNLPNAPQEHVHKAVEGDDEPLPINLPRAELELCKVSCKAADSENKLAGKSLLLVRLVMIRCMQCHAKNQVAVPTNNELGCSCHRCSAKMLGRVVEVRVEE